ncbi:flagellar biosynthetic protein FliO [Curtobacterium sp. MMLR14_010]|uniref:flagellar biosynthetic protein FliO n=1 Tax=Curtobacterium sp. MMLR14_010 TaxID=1898743 RepID=UPI0008DD7BCF|nr:flagellar biosynthetic protein FliO [Curtobacterium sp. MMLR14_010]OII34846.1 flagellar biosynthetic protein FliO [Curtobacterium sp. MMLR14_010]
MDTLVITLRVALSLGVVLALMWVLHRRTAKGQFGRAKARGRRSAAIEVVGRTGIGGKASVVVVDVEGERLVLGVTEHGVSLLTSGEAPAPELTIVTGAVQLPVRAVPVAAPTQTPVPTPSAEAFRQELALQDQAATSLPSAPAAEPLPMRPRNRDRRPQRTVVPTSAQLQGSLLSADTWRQAAAALRSRRAG